MARDTWSNQVRATPKPGVDKDFVQSLPVQLLFDQAGTRHDHRLFDFGWTGRPLITSAAAPNLRCVSWCTNR